MSKDELTLKASTIVRVLELTMQEVPPQTIAATLRIKHVREIRKAHGYPHEPTMRDQVRQLRPLRDYDVTFDTDITPRPPLDDAPRRLFGGAA